MHMTILQSLKSWLGMILSASVPTSTTTCPSTMAGMDHGGPPLAPDMGHGIENAAADRRAHRASSGMTHTDLSPKMVSDRPADQVI
jgi:hypothetical protein